MKKIFTLLLGLLAHQAVAQTGLSVPQLSNCDSVVQHFIQRWNIPGASVAVAKDGKLVYARAFGYADLARTTPMQPHHLLRVASVSKPITAIAVMKLVENGQIDLQHKAFGPDGYLRGAYYAQAITDRRIYDITVQNLLEHAGGWDRTVGCDGYGSCDPINFPLHVAQVLKAPSPVGDSTLIKFMLMKGLDFDPGTNYAYSNVGYLVLGKIIEAVTGQAYERWVREQLLEPSGVQEAHLGHNLLPDHLEREGEYFSGHRSRSCYGTGELVPTPYGGRNLEAMNAHGGWVFSARDLVRLLLAADGFTTRPDLLRPATVAAMVQPSIHNRNYAKGWSVNANHTWWHSGNLDGTASCAVRTASGYTWAILLNKCEAAPQFWADLHLLGWTCIQGATSWPTHDLFSPEQNARNLRVTAADSSEAALAWTNGSGTRRLLVVKAGGPVDAFPLDGVRYAAQAAFGEGAALGNGNFVVADEPASTARVTNLEPGRPYYARVIEYRQDASTGNRPVYTLDGNPTLRLNDNMASAGLPAAPPQLTVFPNPAAGEISVGGANSTLHYDLLNAQGTRVQTGALEPGHTISLTKLPPGVYLIRLGEKNRYVLKRFIKS